MADEDGADSGQPKGFDFGFPVYSLGVPTLEVSNLLGQAKVVACAYGWGPSPEIHSSIPQITLVGRNATPLEEAFRVFNNWSAYPGDDALELSFVFLKDGGYLVCLSPETKALQLRTLGYTRASSPIILMTAWIKEFDTRHPLLGQLRRWHAGRRLAPFHLGAATLGDSEDPSPENLRPLPPELNILKFQATFADEDSLTASDPLFSLVELYRNRDNASRKTVAESLPDRPKPTPSEVRKHRFKMLRTHLPVTSLRVAQTGRCTVLRDSLGPPPIRRWQVVQAIGNLQISQRLTDGGFHYEQIPSDDLAHRVAEVLDTWCEVADGRVEAFSFADKVLAEQIRLDAIACLTRLGIQDIPEKLPPLVETLGAHELLGQD